MDMKKLLIPSAIAAIILSSVFPATAANITCQLNPATGKIEASQAWKNVLGDEADRACEKAMPSAKNQQATVAERVAPSISMERQISEAVDAALASKASKMMQHSAPPVAVESRPVAPSKTWQVEVKDVTLANTFTRWAESSGQKVRWDAEKHVLVEAPDTLGGSFEDAVTTVLSSPGIAQGAYPLEVCFYPNNPPLARVTRKGEQKECK